MECGSARKARSLDEEEQVVPESNYEDGQEFDLPLPTTTRGPPPSFGSPKPRAKRSKPTEEIPEEDYGYPYDYDLPTTTSRGPSVINGSPKPHYMRGKRGYKPSNNDLEA